MWNLKNRLKSIVHVGGARTPIDFTSNQSQIIWRDTGAKIVKAQWKRDQHQSTVPLHILKVLDLYREAEGDSRQSQSPCFVCSRVETRQAPIRKAVRCALCLLSSHSSCLEEQMRLLKESHGSSQKREQHHILPLKPPTNFVIPRCFVSRCEWVGTCVGLLLLLMMLL